MPDPMEPVTIDRAQPQVLSPSPVPGQELPQRRAADTANYSGEWTVLVLGILGWLTTFFMDAAQNESWADITAPKFMALHVAQLFSVVISIVAAKRMK